MLFRRYSRLLLAGAVITAALTGGTGTALASPDPGQQPDIPTIDEWQIQFPTTMTNPLDESGPSDDWVASGCIAKSPR